jgi:hypothetical protein
MKNGMNIKRSGVQYKQQNVHIYFVKSCFNQREMTRVIGESSWALKGHTAQARWDHLDRVHPDQKILEVIRQERLVFVIGGEDVYSRDFIFPVIHFVHSFILCITSIPCCYCSKLGTRSD